MPQEIYVERDEKEGLRQGDILGRDKLVEILRGHQQYFADMDNPFTHFAVMTQSCDLHPNRIVNFIFLAVVRPLDTLFSHYDLCCPGNTNRVKGVMEDLFDYKYNKRSLFYIPRNLGHKILHDSAIDLRVMFSLTRRHYKELVNARLIGLDDLYAAKLGHMAGEMFSRVAIPSWNEANEAEGGKGSTRNDVVRDMYGGLAGHEEQAYTTLISKRIKDRKANGEPELGEKCEVDECQNPLETYVWRVHPKSFEIQKRLVCLLCAKDNQNIGDSEWKKMFRTSKTPKPKPKQK